MVLQVALLCVLAYVAGSAPSGYLLVRAARGLDVRDFGSHNVGAINVFRVGGRWLGIATLLVDTGKAFVVVMTASALRFPVWAICLAAFAVMLGHALSAWFLVTEHRLSGGKSVACCLGVVTGIAVAGLWPWYVAVVPPSLWLLGLLGPRLVLGHWERISPVTMTAMLSVPVTAWLGGVRGPCLLLAVAMAVLVLGRHRSNIARLLKGTEPRLGQRHATEALVPASAPPAELLQT